MRAVNTDARNIGLWRRCRRQHRRVGRVVRDDIDAGVGSYNDRCVGRKRKAANNISSPHDNGKWTVVEAPSEGDTRPRSGSETVSRGRVERTVCT